MSQFLQNAKVRIVILPLLSVLGTICVMVYPAGHQAFCRTIENLVI